MFEHFRSARCAPPLCAENVLVCDRNTRERTRVALAQPLVSGSRALETFFFVERDKCVEKWIERARALQKIASQFGA